MKATNKNTGILATEVSQAVEAGDEVVEVKTGAIVKVNSVLTNFVIIEQAVNYKDGDKQGTIVRLQKLSKDGFIKRFLHKANAEASTNATVEANADTTIATDADATTTAQAVVSTNKDGNA